MSKDSLYQAAKRGDLKVVKTFLAQGVYVDEKESLDAEFSYREVTPLFIACNNGHVEVIKELIKAGADLFMKCKSNHDKELTPVDIAQELENIDSFIAFLDTSLYPDFRNPMLISLLAESFSMYRTFNLSFEEEYIKGAKLKKSCHTFLAKLIAEKADLNSPCTSEKKTLLFYATKFLDGNNDKRIIKMLLENGANPNLKYKGNYTPLHHSIKYSYDQIVALLIEHNADVTAVKPGNNYTPLHYAAEASYSSVRIINLIKKSGQEFDLLAENKNGEIPYDLARDNCHYNIATLIKPPTAELKRWREEKESQKERWSPERSAWCAAVALAIPRTAAGKPATEISENLERGSSKRARV
jgi:ankyrin repeat protein